VRSLPIRSLPVLALSTAALLLAPVLPAYSAAAPAIKFIRVQYDSPGVDRRANASLNAEYATIKNTSRQAVDLEGWTLRDKTGYTYTFGAVILKAGKQLVVRTGQGGDTATTLFWGRRAYVWNNDKDIAYLRNASAKLVHSCSWTTMRPGAKTCP
jgi:hypothetical protein